MSGWLDAADIYILKGHFQQTAEFIRITNARKKICVSACAYVCACSQRHTNTVALLFLFSISYYHSPQADLIKA